MVFSWRQHHISTWTLFLKCRTSSLCFHSNLWGLCFLGLFKKHYCNLLMSSTDLKKYQNAPPSWFYQLCNHANGITRRVIACSHWLTFLPHRQIWFAVMPLWFNGGGGADSEWGSICCDTTKGRAWHESPCTLHDFAIHEKLRAGIPDRGKKPNDWRTLPRAFVTFHLNCFSRFLSTNCRQFVSNLRIVCALCAQWLKSFRMDVSFRQMSSVEGPWFFVIALIISLYITSFLTTWAVGRLHSAGKSWPQRAKRVIFLVWHMLLRHSFREIWKWRSLLLVSGTSP